MSAKKPKIVQATDEDVAQYGSTASPGESSSAGQPAEGASAEMAPESDAVELSGESKLEADLAEMKDRFLRAKADYQNMQTRSSREHREALRFANAEFAKSLLAILDDFERAFEAAQSAESAQSVVEGVRMVYEHFLKVLKDQGVEPIEASDAVFNPHEHEALSQAPSDEHEAGAVMFVHQRGYRLHDRVLRPARVVVSSGPAQADQQADQEGD